MKRMLYPSAFSRALINRICRFGVLDRDRTPAMKREERLLCQEFRSKKAEIMTGYPTCYSCDQCGCGISDYVDWLEIKIDSLELGARAYMMTLTHLEGTVEWKNVVHSYRRAIGICEEEHYIYSRGLSVVLIGYRHGDCIAEGYAYVTFCILLCNT